MQRRRGNFPYDFDTAYPDHPPPAMPPNPIQYSPPPPAIPPPVASAAPGASSAPVPSAAEGQASTPPLAPAPPELKSEAPESPARKRRRRSGPLQRFSGQRNVPAPPPPDQPEPSHHSRKCAICHHPDREAIDDDFVNWIRVLDTSLEFDIPATTIRRHARATGLSERRRVKYHAALDLVIEHAGRAACTGDTIIRAIRAASCLDEFGRWVEPPKHVIFTTEHLSSPGFPPPAATPALPLATDFRTFSSRQGTAELVSSPAEGAVPKSPPNSFRQGTASAVPKNPSASGVLTPEVQETAGHPPYGTDSIDNPVLELAPPATTEGVLIDPGSD